MLADAEGLVGISRMHQRMQRRDVRGFVQTAHVLMELQDVFAALLSEFRCNGLLHVGAHPAIHPWPHQIRRIGAIRQAEQRIAEADEVLRQDQRVPGHLFQQLPPELRKVKIRIQHAAQPIVKLLQPLEGLSEHRHLHVLCLKSVLQRLYQIDQHGILSPDAYSWMRPDSSALMGMTAMASITHIASGTPVQQKAV